MNFELSEEQQMLKDMARKFAEHEMLPILKQCERQHRIDSNLTKKMADQGLLALHLPKEYGGGGLDYVSASIAWEQLSWISWTQTLAGLGHAVLAGTIIAKVADEQQKKKYLLPLCQGSLIIAMAAVEPNAGSDAGAIETTAISDGDNWIINGTKNFITSGGIADIILVLTQTDKTKGTGGIAIIAVDKNTPGFSCVPVDMIGGQTGDISNLAFVDCIVPKTNLVGQIGRGLQNALIGIDTARLFISSSAIGMAQSCLDTCVKYAKDRKQFGKPIASFQLVQETIARMSAEISAIRWQVYYAAELKSKNLSHGKELSSAKWLATELAVRSSAEAIRIHGAYGCTDDFPAEHHYRDAIMSTILGGTTEMHKLTIGRELLDINAIS